jgi:hypothetical protein
MTNQVEQQNVNNGKRLAEESETGSRGFTPAFSENCPGTNN